MTRRKVRRKIDKATVSVARTSTPVRGVSTQDNDGIFSDGEEPLFFSDSDRDDEDGDKKCDTVKNNGVGCYKKIKPSDQPNDAENCDSNRLSAVDILSDDDAGDDDGDGSCIFQQTCRLNANDTMYNIRHSPSLIRQRLPSSMLLLSSDGSGDEGDGIHLHYCATSKGLQPPASSSASTTNKTASKTANANNHANDKDDKFSGTSKVNDDPRRTPPSYQTFWQCLWQHFVIRDEKAEGIDLDVEYSVISQRVWSSFRLIGIFERLMFIGTWLCLDMFLDVICTVPIKALLSIIPIIKGFFTNTEMPLQYIVQMIIVISGIWFMENVDISYMYHNIRGQSTIKYYVLINMCEVFDKLFSALAQDVTDSLVLKASKCKGVYDLLIVTFLLFLSIVAILLHTIVVMLQMIALNVAINSKTSGILTIILSNQFLEVKSSVFKKITKSSLYQLVCWDVRERFQYFLMLTLIAIRNLSAYAWDVEYFVNFLLGNLALAYGSEVVVDWFKHSFVTRFNGLWHTNYLEHEYVLCHAMIGGVKRQSSTEGRMRMVRRQFGYLPFPMMFLVYKFLSSSFEVDSILVFGLIWCILVCVKVIGWQSLNKFLKWRYQRVSMKFTTPPNPSEYGCEDIAEGISFPLGPNDRFAFKLKP
eukprot:m.139378 g.139378  ORF g.139378 m.139378 type:complete len:644 (+) comp21271_c0_seq1:27-1958(+)